MCDRTSIGRDYISILPGNYHATAQGECLSTLLGSCVAACLYDPAAKIIGMNHFLTGDTHSRQKTPLLLTESGRYGVHAMELLINAMYKLGARRQNLRAKVFGGATMIQQTGPDNPGIGRLNCAFIQDFLKNEKIPLMSHDLGGTYGRVIYFIPEDFSVLVRRIRKTIMRDVVKRESRLLEKTREKVRMPSNDHILWKQPPH